MQKAVANPGSLEVLEAWLRLSPEDQSKVRSLIKGCKFRDVALDPSQDSWMSQTNTALSHEVARATIVAFVFDYTKSAQNNYWGVEVSAFELKMKSLREM